MKTVSVEATERSTGKPVTSGNAPVRVDATTLVSKLRRAVEERESEGSSVNERPFVRERAEKTFTFRLTQSDAERLSQMKEMTGAGTLSEVILNALAIYDLLIEHVANGYTINIERPVA